MGKRRKLWLLSLAAGVLGLIIGATISAPVIVDKFDAHAPPTFMDTFIPNVIVIIPFALAPAVLVLIVGWVVSKTRNPDSDTSSSAR